MKRQKAFSPDLLRDIHSEPTLRAVSTEELEVVDSPRELMPMSLHEETRLNECETIITEGINTFIEVGQALSEIRNRRLYRSDFKTFEAYAHQRWGIKRQRAYELMGASEVVHNLSEISDILPTKESHAATLLKLSPEEQREAWKEIIDESGTDLHNLTAARIRRKINDRSRKANPLTEEEEQKLQLRQAQEETAKPLTKAIRKTPEQLFITVTGSWLIKYNLEHIWRELRGVSRKIDPNFSDVITVGEAFELGLLKPGR